MEVLKFTFLLMCPDIFDGVNKLAWNEKFECQVL